MARGGGSEVCAEGIDNESKDANSATFEASNDDFVLSSRAEPLSADEGDLTGARVGLSATGASTRAEDCCSSRWIECADLSLTAVCCGI